MCLRNGIINSRVKERSRFYGYLINRNANSTAMSANTQIRDSVRSTELSFIFRIDGPTNYLRDKKISLANFLPFFPFIVTPIETIQLNRNRSFRNISVRTAVDIDRARHVKRGIALKKGEQRVLFTPLIANNRRDRSDLAFPPIRRLRGHTVRRRIISG